MRANRFQSCKTFILLLATALWLACNPSSQQQRRSPKKQAIKTPSIDAKKQQEGIDGELPSTVRENKDSDGISRDGADNRGEIAADPENPPPANDSGIDATQMQVIENTGDVSCDGQPTNLRTDHIRVVFTRNPTYEATVSWSTGTDTVENFVLFDTESISSKAEGEKIYSYKQDADFSGAYEDGNLFYRHTHIKNLSPDTTYYFVIASDGDISEEYHFRTAPGGNKAFSFLSGGDSRTDVENRTAMNQRMRSLLQSDASIVALLHGGDMVSDGGTFQDWDCWMRNHQQTITDNGRVLPIIPTRGNHEKSAELFNQVFGLNGDLSDAYYTVDLGELSVIVLNTELSLEGNQHDFLSNQLQMLANSSKKWLMAGYHRPAYAAQKSNGGAKSSWVPLFDEYKLDIVFESDGHVLKKTIPLREGIRDDINGVIYVGEGGLGVSQRGADRKDEFYFSEAGGYAKGVDTSHVQHISISSEKVDFKVVRRDGSIPADEAFIVTPKTR